MKRLLSFFFVVCVSLSLLTAFSVTANAEELTDYEIRQDVYLDFKNEWSGDTDPMDIYENFLNFTPNNGTQEIFEDNFYITTSRILYYRGLLYKTVFNIFAPPDGYPFELNKNNRVTLDNFYHRILIKEQNMLKYINTYDTLYALITYMDGTTERVECKGEIDSDQSLDMAFEFKPTKNVQRFDIYIEADLSANYKTKDSQMLSYITVYLGETKGDNKYNFSIDIQSEEAGLLSGILGWIQNIWNKMTDTFDKITEIGSYILELPSKLWNLISEGLQYLFIPTEEAITEFKSKMDTLLENKLGAVYQVSNTVIEAWDRIQESDETDTIEFPSTTINLPVGNEFTFGGYDVKIVPDGFTIVVTALKSIVGIVCTIAFVNGLRKRYDEVMGVVQ